MMYPFLTLDDEILLRLNQILTDAEGRSRANGTKIWITSNGKCLVENSYSQIPERVLRNIVRIIEARSCEIIQKWTDFFGEVHYYC